MEDAIAPSWEGSCDNRKQAEERRKQDIRLPSENRHPPLASLLVVPATTESRVAHSGRARSPTTSLSEADAFTPVEGIDSAPPVRCHLRRRSARVEPAAARTYRSHAPPSPDTVTPVRCALILTSVIATAHCQIPAIFTSLLCPAHGATAAGSGPLVQLCHARATAPSRTPPPPAGPPGPGTAATARCPASPAAVRPARRSPGRSAGARHPGRTPSAP